jgi:hypothetical protein
MKRSYLTKWKTNNGTYYVYIIWSPDTQMLLPTTAIIHMSNLHIHYIQIM